MMKNFLFIFLLFSVAVYSQSEQIILDEDFQDWDGVKTFYVDSQNDGSGEIDLRKFAITNDDAFVYLLLSIDREINLQSSNYLTLYIDTDDNNQTGVSIGGIGADLVYKFGSRKGTFYKNGQEITIGQHDVGFVSSPTVSSKSFEMLFYKNAAIDGAPLFPSNSIRIVVADNVNGGDVLPDSSGGFLFKMISKEFLPPNYLIAKNDTSNLRIMAYNVLRDGIFKDENYDSFKRIFQAVRPDIIGFEEVYKHSGSELAQLVSEFTQDTLQYYGNSQSDVHVVSRFPVLDTYQLDGNAAFLIDLNKYGKKMLFVVAHPPCCNKDDSRQKEIDHIMAFIRDANLEEGTPIVIVGDMNFVGSSQQVRTLLTGNIINEDQYGHDFTPDWDGTNLDDAKPITTGYPATFTWYSASSSYNPGRLDYIVYTGSVMKLKNSFALFTPALSSDTLTKYSLLKNDATSSSDHLPVVADFGLGFSSGNISKFGGVPSTFEVEQNFPNPFGKSSASHSPVTQITFSVPANTNKVSASLFVYNVLGELVFVRKNIYLHTGVNFVRVSFEDFPSGVYFYRMAMGNNSFSSVKKMIYLK